MINKKVDTMLLRKRYEKDIYGYIGLEKVFGRYIYTYKVYKDISENLPIQNFDNPLLAHVSITDKCNLHCPYCYARDGSYAKDMEFTEYKHILDKLDKAEVLSVILTGGEPLLHPNINEILDYSISKKIAVLLLSNLTLLDTLNLSILKSPYLAFQISLNGIWNDDREQNEELMQTVHNYQRVKRLNVPIIVTVVIDNKRINLHKLFMFLEKYKITSVRFGLLINLGGCSQVEEQINEYLSYVKEVTQEILKYKKYHPDVYFSLQTEFVEFADPYMARRATLCEAGISELFIDRNGDVYPCPLFKSFDIFYCGNLLNDSIKEVWNSFAMDKMREISLRQMGCEDCNNRCGVWCRGLVYSYTKKLSDKSLFCLKNMKV